MEDRSPSRNLLRSKVSIRANILKKRSSSEKIIKSSNRETVSRFLPSRENSEIDKDLLSYRDYKKYISKPPVIQSVTRSNSTRKYTLSPENSYQKLVNSIIQGPPQPRAWLQQADVQRRQLKISLEPLLITRKRFNNRTDRERTPSGKEVKSIIREFRQEVKRIRNKILML